MFKRLASMKILVTLAIYFSLALPVAAETLQKHDLIGNWKTSTPSYGIRQKIAKFIAGPNEQKMRLAISEDYKIIFERVFEDGKTETIESNNIKAVDDVYIVDLPRSNNASYKLVLSGWRTKHARFLFGHFYLYNKEGLFNGWAIAFEPAE